MPKKLLLALLVASHKLRHYFQGHPIKVVSGYPLRECSEAPMLQEGSPNGTLSCKRLTWSSAQPESSRGLHSPTLWPNGPTPRCLKQAKTDPLSPGSEAPDGWVMYFDGTFAHQGAGAGAVLISPTQDKLYYAVQLCFQHGEKVSNNIAEYEGLIAGLKAAAALGVKRLTVRGDS